MLTICGSRVDGRSRPHPARHICGLAVERGTRQLSERAARRSPVRRNDSATDPWQPAPVGGRVMQLLDQPYSADDLGDVERRVRDSAPGKPPVGGEPCGRLAASPGLEVAGTTSPSPGVAQPDVEGPDLHRQGSPAGRRRWNLRPGSRSRSRRSTAAPPAPALAAARRARSENHR